MLLGKTYVYLKLEQNNSFCFTSKLTYLVAVISWGITTGDRRPVFTLLSHLKWLLCSFWLKHLQFIVNIFNFIFFLRLNFFAALMMCYSTGREFRKYVFLSLSFNNHIQNSDSLIFSADFLNSIFFCSQNFSTNIFIINLYGRKRLKNPICSTCTP